MSDRSKGNGPLGYQNWKAALAGRPHSRMSEAFLYSDASITGELSAEEPHKPYGLLNMLPDHRGSQLAPVIALRIQMHLEAELPSFQETDTASFHGGNIADEIAALAALAMGIRLRAGATTRDFYPGDALGRPCADRAIPVLLPPDSRPGPRIPGATGQHNLNELFLPYLVTYPTLEPGDATALVRSARFYSDALWIAEAEPDLAWLFLVSALEAVATHVHEETSEPRAVLATSHPRLVKALEPHGEELVDEVAMLLLPYLKATARFRDFVLEYLPPPPQKRPPHEHLCVKWEKNSLRESLEKIYGHRSRALHDGTPFPPPMSDHPPIPSEIPMGATATLGGVWLAEDMPMLMPVFEYITRGVLLNWWKAVAKVSAPKGCETKDTTETQTQSSPESLGDDGQTGGRPTGGPLTC